MACSMEENFNSKERVNYRFTVAHNSNVSLIILIKISKKSKKEYSYSLSKKKSLILKSGLKILLNCCAYKLFLSTYVVKIRNLVISPHFSFVILFFVFLSFKPIHLCECFSQIKISSHFCSFFPIHFYLWFYFCFSFKYVFLSKVYWY